MAGKWWPGQYLKFGGERAAPFYDLVRPLVAAVAGKSAARAPWTLPVPPSQPVLSLQGEPPDRRSVLRVLDLGCGPGGLSRQLAEWAGQVSGLRVALTGVDASPDMLAIARAGVKRGEADPKVEEAWVQDTIEAFVGRHDVQYDLVISNAALHWTRGHRSVFASLPALLAPGGLLGLQMPINQGHPAYRAAARLTESSPYKQKIAASRGSEAPDHPLADHRLSVDEYAQILCANGVTDLVVKSNVYMHELASSGQVLEWIKGSYLTPIEAILPTEMWAQFLSDLEPLVIDAIADSMPPGGATAPYLFTFHRMFVWGRKAGLWVSEESIE